MNPTAVLLAVFTTLSLSACSQGPEPIRWGTDACEQCRMVLSDTQFGAEFVDDKGPIHKFDELGEMALYLAAHPAQGKSYVVNAGTGELIPAEAAIYLSAPQVIGPMGGAIIAFADRKAAEAFVTEHKLQPVKWLTYAEALQSGKEEAAKGVNVHDSH